MLAIEEIWKRTILEKDPSMIAGFTEKPLPSSQVGNVPDSKFRVLSLGTGVVTHSYTAKQAQNWGVLPWFYNLHEKSMPLVDMLSFSGGTLVDYDVTLYFKSRGSEDYYLRIQVRINACNPLFRNVRVLTFLFPTFDHSFYSKI